MSARPKNCTETNRRRALQLLSSSFAVALARCGQPLEEIVPYVNAPERLVPGQPIRYATALPMAGYGRGVLGITVDGRPIKIEGNPNDKYSGGGTDVFAEAEVLSLYDPDRSRVPVKDGIVASWDQFGSEWANWPDTQSSRGGAGMAFVSGRITSPTLLRILTSLKRRYPQLRQYRYEPVHDDQARGGARLAFGRNLDAIHGLDEADVFVVLDADPLGPGPNFLHNASRFSVRRSSTRPQRIYVAESGLTLMGAMADHRLALAPQRIGLAARSLGKELGLDTGAFPLTAQEQQFIASAASDLRRPQTRGLVLTGESQAADIHALAHFLNSRIQAPIDLVPSIDPAEQDHAQSFTALLQDLKSGLIRTLIVMDANLVYDSADPAQTGRMIAALPFTVHCGIWADETAAYCKWHVPLSHPLESWGDLKSPDGSVLLAQPLIRPLYDTRSASEFLASLGEQPASGARDLLRATWMPGVNGNFEDWWREGLTTGVVPNSASQTVSATPAMPSFQALQGPPESFTIAIAPSPVVWDGRYANNAWLQECPTPFTKEVWGNAVQLSPEDAQRLDVSPGDGVFIKRGNVEIEAVAAVLNGQAQGTARAFLGQGRWRAGDIGSGVGVRIAGLTTTGLERLIGGVSLRPSGKSGLLHTTQYHTRLEGRDEDIFPLAPASRITQRIAELKPDTGGIVPPLPANQYAWAMVIDNNLCIGCNACVVACQAENNVGVVGPNEVDLRPRHALAAHRRLRTAPNRAN